MRPGDMASLHLETRVHWAPKTPNEPVITGHCLGCLWQSSYFIPINQWQFCSHCWSTQTLPVNPDSSLSYAPTSSTTSANPGGTVFTAHPVMDHSSVLHYCHANPRHHERSRPLHRRHARAMAGTLN